MSPLELSAASQEPVCASSTIASILRIDCASCFLRRATCAGDVDSARAGAPMVVTCGSLPSWASEAAVGTGVGRSDGDLARRRSTSSLASSNDWRGTSSGRMSVCLGPSVNPAARSSEAPPDTVQMRSWKTGLVRWIVRKLGLLGCDIALPRYRPSPIRVDRPARARSIAAACSFGGS
eukprot:scaffold249072_cov30-Tisochrysis_lutea.AAC.4